MCNLHFQYCQKIVVLSKDKTKVLLCKRKGEEDYDGTFSFIGGKMETTDLSLVEGLKREKNEEVGKEFQINIYPTFSFNILFRKKDGNAMILPHYIGIYEDGEVNLNEEYSEYKWIEIDKIEEFEPKVPTVTDALKNLLKLEINEKEFILI